MFCLDVLRSLGHGDPSVLELDSDSLHRRLVTCRLHSSASHKAPDYCKDKAPEQPREICESSFSASAVLLILESSLVASIEMGLVTSTLPVANAI
jgi:hypothetical protein